MRTGRLSLATVGILVLWMVCPGCSLTGELGNGKLQKLEITGHTAYQETHGNVTWYIVEGVVKNNSSSNMRSINITVTFHFDDTKVTRMTNAMLEIVEPDHQTPFQLYLRDINCSVEAYRLKASGIETDQKPACEFKIVRCQNYSSAGRYVIVGAVKNVGSRRARSVSILCACYNSKGDLVTITHSYPHPITLDPNEKADFELKLRSGLFPSSFELFIDARRCEKVAWANWGLLTLLIIASVLFVVYMRRRGW